MELIHIYAISAFLISFLVTVGVIPWIVSLCGKYNLYDRPNARKVHSQAIPRLGGLAFLPSLAVAFVVMAVVCLVKEEKFFDFQLSTFLMVVGALIIYVVGVLDDIKDLKATTKFVILAVASALLPLCNLMINNLYGLFGVHEIPLWTGYIVTVFIILVVVNALNLIDGIDGLASGISIIILSVFVWLYLQLHSLVFSVVSAGLLGSVVAFFCFNMFGKVGKNKIFMGDAGSLVLGYLLAYLAIKYQMINEQVFPFRNDALLISFTMFIVPVFDLIRVAFSRLRAGVPMFQADKRHIHHIVMATGCTMRQTLCIIISLVLLFFVVNFALSDFGVGFTWIFLLDIVIFVLFNLVINKLKKE